MALRLRLLLGALGLAGLAACASLVQLDSSDSDSGGDGGTSSGTGTSSSGGGSLDGGITTEAGVSIGANVVTFQRSTCGMAQTQSIAVKNDSEVSVSVDVSLTADPVFSLANATAGAVHLTIEPHQASSFVIQAKSSTAGVNTADVVVKIGEEEHHINVSLETSGGTLKFEPPTVDFGVLRPDTASTAQTVIFRNDGNDRLRVAGFAGSTNFTIDGLPVEIEPGATIERSVVMTAGGVGAPISEALEAQVDGKCGDAPVTLTLKGQRLEALQTLNPLAADFGDVNCGAAAPGAKPLTLSNFTGAKAAYTLSLGKSPSPFAFTNSNPTSELAPGAATNPTSATISVSLANPLPQVPQDLTDTLTVTISGGTSFSVPLHARIRGALLEVSATTLKLSRSSGSSGTGKVILTNKGNVNACVKYDRSNNTFLSEDYSCWCCGCSVSDDTDQVNAGASTDWSVRYYSGSSATTITANVVRCSGTGGQTAPLCGAAPKITVSSN